MAISAWPMGVYFLVELGIGVWSSSISVLSDAFHVFSAVGGVVVAIGAARLARRPRGRGAELRLVPGRAPRRARERRLPAGNGAGRDHDGHDAARRANRPSNGTDAPRRGGRAGDRARLARADLKESRSDLNVKSALRHIIEILVGRLVTIVAAPVMRFTGFLLIEPILGMSSDSCSSGRAGTSCGTRRSVRWRGVRATTSPPSLPRRSKTPRGPQRASGPRVVADEWSPPALRPSSSAAPRLHSHGDGRTAPAAPRGPPERGGHPRPDRGVDHVFGFAMTLVPVANEVIFSRVAPALPRRVRRPLRRALARGRPPRLRPPLRRGRSAASLLAASRRRERHGGERFKRAFSPAIRHRAFRQTMSDGESSPRDSGPMLRAQARATVARYGDPGQSTAHDGSAEREQGTMGRGGDIMDASLESAS